MKSQFFITGTDTGVGKTWFTSWLLRAWRKQGLPAIGLKPIATGDREDAENLHKACDAALPLDEINPYFFRLASSPLVSARAEDRRINFNELNEKIKTYKKNHSPLLIEGVGGWRVPLAPGYDVRDWAQDINLPVIIVALSRLGALNHTFLTVESIAAAGLTCAGIVLNLGPEEITPEKSLLYQKNAAVLSSHLPLPVFQFDRAAESSMQIPSWLGRKEI